MTKKVDKAKLKAAFSEMKKNPPSVLAKTKKKKGAKQAEKQRIAIGLSKARQAGAKIPSPNTPTRADVLKRLHERSKNA